MADQRKSDWELLTEPGLAFDLLRIAGVACVILSLIFPWIAEVGDDGDLWEFPFFMTVYLAFFLVVAIGAADQNILWLFTIMALWAFCLTSLIRLNLPIDRRGLSPKNSRKIRWWLLLIGGGTIVLTNHFATEMTLGSGAWLIFAAALLILGPSKTAVPHIEPNA